MKENEKIQSNKEYELIFVDFDDTLCLHLESVKSYKYLYKYPYNNSISNKNLINYLYNIKKENKIILLTMASSFMLEHKKKWCEENCPSLFDDFVGLSIDCSKKDYISNFKEKILFIDDNSSERSSVEFLNNVTSISPQILLELN